jgi:SAM-dependent methyltransferase
MKIDGQDANKFNKEKGFSMSDFLYNNPELYEMVFDRSAGDVCTDAFQKHLPQAPSSILDIGCGTGRELAKLSETFPDSDCVGFDVTPAMAAFAKKRNPNLTVLTGDMRSCRLNRTFDAIYAVGGSINFALTNDELDQTIKTYQAHAHAGTLLLVEPLNPCHFFGGFQAPKTFSVPYKGKTARGTASYELFKVQQIVERTRTWEFEEKKNNFVETMRFRVIFPSELAYFLTQNGFEILDIFEKPRNSIYVSSMYVVAKFNGKRA